MRDILLKKKQVNFILAVLLKRNQINFILAVLIVMATAYQIVEIIAETPDRPIITQQDVPVVQQDNIEGEVQMPEKQGQDAKPLPKTNPCKKEITSDEKLWIAMPAWNNPALLHVALKSVINQQDIPIKKVKVVIVEDHSDKMFTEHDKKMYDQTINDKVDVTFLRDEEYTSGKQGSAFGKWVAFEHIRKYALPDEYVFVLDGDDTLADSMVLSYVYYKLRRHKPWFAWGKHNGKYSEQCHDLARVNHDKAKSTFDVRHGVWSFCHPRMFQAHLLHELDKSDFQRDNGEWLQKSTDRPFIFKFLELAGRDRTLYLGTRALYNYTITADNGLKVFSDQTISGDKDLVNNRSPATQATSQLYVIACVYDRNNTATFLQHLLASEMGPNQVLNIHICNNNAHRQDELEQLAEKLLAQQQHETTNNPTLQIHKMSYNARGFNRFVLAKQLMDQEFVDYVMMLDDDQYVRKRTLAKVYAAREPQTYKTWYGKNWDLEDKPISYWKVRDAAIKGSDPHKFSDMAPEVSSWQYGGTGMSVIDANIFRKHQLFEIPHDFMFVEDLWLSYIVGLSHWKIGRLFVQFDGPGQEFGRKTGQFLALHERKEELFALTGYLACGAARDKNRNSAKRP